MAFAISIVGQVVAVIDSRSSHAGSIVPLCWQDLSFSLLSVAYLRLGLAGYSPYLTVIIPALPVVGLRNMVSLLRPQQPSA